MVKSALLPGARLVEFYLAKDDFDELHRGGVPKLDSVYQLQVLTATEDKAEGMAAFIEKREGVWKGR